jgi:glutamyl-tRNA reductase
VLLCLSSNHRNATFEVLEKLSVGAPGAARGLVHGGEIVTGAVVLATCNRFEAYLDIDEPLVGAEAVALAETIDAISSASGVSSDELLESVQVHTGEDAARHLFSVTAGLESVVIGEDEISGQVGRALDQARKDGTTSRNLERLFQRATHTSRGVKNRTAIGGTKRSLVRFALELASSRVPDWSEARVLVVGTGRYAATTVGALRDRGAQRIAVYSTSGRAPAFALRHGVAEAGALRDAITEADVVITCTTSVVVTASDIPDDSRRLLIDLGLPRNIAPDVARATGVELLDLETISLHAPLDELNTVADARTSVGDAASEFTAALRAESSIVTLRRHVFDLLDAEIDRARGRGAGEETERALRHLAGVLLHTPSVRARELAAEGRDGEFAAALGTLFGLDAPTAASLTAVEDDAASA